MYFLAIWFCLIFCVCGLFSSDCRTVVLASGVHTVVGWGCSRGCAGFLMGGMGACPLAGGAISRSTFTGSCGVRRTLSSLFADGWVSTLQVVWLEASQHSSLQAVVGARPWQNGDLWESSHFLETRPLVNLPQQWATANLHLLPGTLQDPHGGLSQTLMESLLSSGSKCM